MVAGATKLSPTTDSETPSASTPFSAPSTAIIIDTATAYLNEREVGEGTVLKPGLARRIR